MPAMRGEVYVRPVPTQAPAPTKGTP
jgi:hypothetical protein